MKAISIYLFVHYLFPIFNQAQSQLLHPIIDIISSIFILELISFITDSYSELKPKEATQTGVESNRSYSVSDIFI